MIPPVIINEHGDVAVYSTIEAAAVALEPIDVRNNEYVAYDSNGFVLSLVPGQHRVTIIGRVSLTPATEAASEALRSFIERASGQALPSDTKSLSALISAYVQRFGYAA